MLHLFPTPPPQRQFLMDKAAERAEFTQEARAQAQAEAAAQEVDDVLLDPGQPLRGLSWARRIC